MGKYKLDQEEQEILDAFESGRLESIPNAKEEIKRHREYAAATLKKDKRINIRIVARDLSEIQKLAIREGIPFHTKHL